jgi:hypothetical protein
MRWLVLLVCTTLFASAGIVIVSHWPYSEAMLVSGLQDTFKTRVKIEKFRRFYFPHPGCEADLVTLESSAKNPGGMPIATIRRMKIIGRYSDLILRPHHLAEIRLEGLHVRIPAPSERDGPGGGGRSGEESWNISIGSVTADGSVLEFAKQNDKESLKFDVHTLRVESIAPGGPMYYDVKMHIPEPPGELESKGTFGPWRLGQIEKIPLQGLVTLRNASLDKYPGIGGTVQSDDRFSGTLEQLQVIGNANVTDFHLKQPSHSVRLTSQFLVTVDTLKGEARLRNVTAKIGQSNLQVQGNVAKNTKHGRRETSLDFSIAQGRAEDLLWLFNSAAKPPMLGAATCSGHVVVPKFGSGFLKQLALTGRFEVHDGHFQKPTQKKANELSARALGMKLKDGFDAPEAAVTSLSSEVTIANGVVQLSRLYFELPGARARVQGTYGLSSHQVDLHGNLWTDSTVSKDTTGIASVMLKPIDPLFRRKHAGAMVGVEMTGDMDEPHFGTVFTKNKAGWRGKPSAGGSQR